MKGYMPADYNQQVMCTILYYAGFGRPYIKFELNPFAIYSCVLEKAIFMLYSMFHQDRTNVLDMPHRIWRKISQIM